MHPGIDLRLSVGNREQIIEGLHNHDVDLAIMGRPPTDMKVVANPIGDHSHIMAGLGISFFSAHTIDAEIIVGRLVVLTVRGLPIVRQWYAVHLSGWFMMPACAPLIEFLRQRG